MSNLVVDLIPNVVPKVDELWLSVEQTFYMLSVSGVIAFTLGLFFGVVLIVTKHCVLRNIGSHNSYSGII